jgi:hypothetical protein
MAGSARICPSGRCQAGSALLGILGPGGSVIFTPGLPALDEVQAAQFAQKGGSSSFRFSESCQDSRCLNWQNERCEVASAAVIRNDDLPTNLPACGIRARCRWFAQEGRAACGACPMVMRQTRSDAERKHGDDDLTDS